MSRLLLRYMLSITVLFLLNETYNAIVSYNILNCCLQPPSAVTSTSHLEPGLTSQMLGLIEASHLKILWYQSSMMTLLNHASPLSVLFKEVLWMLSAVLNQIELQSEFAMMIVSSCMYYNNVTITLL